MIVECPYCGLDIDIDDSNLIDLGSDNYLEDYVCDNCGKEFDVYVEFEPQGSTEEITYEKCQCCGKEYKTRYLYQKGRTFPFPNDENYNILCCSCYLSLMNDEYNEFNM